MSSLPIEEITSAKTFGREIGEALYSGESAYCTIDTAAGYTKSGAPFIAIGGRDLWLVAEQVQALLQERKDSNGLTTELQTMLHIVNNACERFEQGAK